MLSETGTLREPSTHTKEMLPLKTYAPGCCMDLLGGELSLLSNDEETRYRPLEDFRLQNLKPSDRRQVSQPSDAERSQI